MEDLVKKEDMDRHGNPYQISYEGSPANRFTDSVETAATYGGTTDQIYINAYREYNQEKRKNCCRGSDPNPGEKKYTTDQLDPRKHHRQYIYPPVRNDLIAGDGFGEFGGVVNLVHAGVNKYSGDVKSENKRNISVCQTFFNKPYHGYGPNGNPLLFQATRPSGNNFTFSCPLEASLKRTSSS